MYKVGLMSYLEVGIIGPMEGPTMVQKSLMIPKPSTKGAQKATLNVNGKSDHDDSREIVADFPQVGELSESMIHHC